MSGGWQYVLNVGVVQQIQLAGKVGHVVHRAPGEWVALYDGVFLSVEPTETEAQAAVEDAARIKTRRTA